MEGLRGGPKQTGFHGAIGVHRDGSFMVDQVHEGLRGSKD